MQKAALSIATIAITSLVLAQSSPGPAKTKSLSHAIHAVEDLDTTLAFYRDVFGITANAQDFANPAVPLLTNAPGVTLRLSMMQLPGVRFELTHFKGLERKPSRAKYTDPGAASLVFHVVDLDSIVANAKKAGAEIVTTGGAPVTIGQGLRPPRSILIRDPDGFFVQVIVEAAPSANKPNVQRVSLAYTMESAEATKAFYTGQLGIELKGDIKYSKDPAYAKLVGAPAGTEFRKLSGTLPPAGANTEPIPIEFTEFKGVPRSKFVLRVRDPGAPALCIQVFDETATIDAMRAAGVPIISKDGQIVDFGGGTRTIFVQDPNGMNLEIFERNPPAPGAANKKG